MVIPFSPILFATGDSRVCVCRCGKNGLFDQVGDGLQREKRRLEKLRGDGAHGVARHIVSWASVKVFRRKRAFGHAVSWAGDRKHRKL
jgi:hypothetical protein